MKVESKQNNYKQIERFLTGLMAFALFYKAINFFEKI